MNTLIVIGILTATAIVGELRHRNQGSIIDCHLELQDH